VYALLDIGHVVLRPGRGAVLHNDAGRWGLFKASDRWRRSENGLRWRRYYDVARICSCCTLSLLFALRHRQVLLETFSLS